MNPPNTKALLHKFSGCVTNSNSNDTNPSAALDVNKIEPFVFDDHAAPEDSKNNVPYQFSTPLSCNSVLAQGKGYNNQPQEHTAPICTNTRRRKRTRNVHFMMAGGKMSSAEDSPINLVDLDRSMDINNSS